MNDARQERAGAKAIDPHGGFIGTHHFPNGEAISFEESGCDLFTRHLQADGAEIPEGSQASGCELARVKCHLDAAVRDLVLGIVHGRPVFCAEFGKRDGYRQIGRLRMADAVANEVRQGAYGKGILVRIMRVAKQALHEIRGAHVVHEIGYKQVGEGIVAEVLNHAAAIGIGVSFL